MWSTIKSLFNFKQEQSYFFPTTYDPSIKNQSATLFFAYISFFIAVCSLIALHFYNQLLAATGMAFLFVCLMIIFYMLRRLSGAKIDLDDRSIELDGKDEESK